MSTEFFDGWLRSEEVKLSNGKTVTIRELSHLAAKEVTDADERFTRAATGVKHGVAECDDMTVEQVMAVMPPEIIEEIGQKVLALSNFGEDEVKNSEGTLSAAS